MKRIISVLAVMAIMAAMVAATAMPAFAKGQQGQPACKGNQLLASVAVPGEAGDDNRNGYSCYNSKTDVFTDERNLNFL